MTSFDAALKPSAPLPPRSSSAAGVPVTPRAEPLPVEPRIDAKKVAPPSVEAAEAAFKAITSSKHLEVSSFHDEATGRYVVRVADNASGRVLIQTPPDELLRFLASAPSLDPPPTLIDA
jgi:hypothetical protein